MWFQAGKGWKEHPLVGQPSLIGSLNTHQHSYSLVLGCIVSFDRKRAGLPKHVLWE